MTVSLDFFVWEVILVAQDDSLDMAADILGDLGNEVGCSGSSGAVEGSSDLNDCSDAAVLDQVTCG